MKIYNYYSATRAFRETEYIQQNKRAFIRLS